MLCEMVTSMISVVGFIYSKSVHTTQLLQFHPWPLPWPCRTMVSVQSWSFTSLFIIFRFGSVCLMCKWLH